MSIRSVYLYGKWVYVGGCYTLYYYNSILIENYWTNAFSVCWPCSIHSATTRISNQFSYTSQIDHNRRILHLIPGFGMWVIVRMWFFFFNIGRRQFFSIGHTTFVEVVVLYRLVVLGWCSWAQTPKKRYFHWLFFFLVRQASDGENSIITTFQRSYIRSLDGTHFTRKSYFRSLDWRNSFSTAII